MSVIGIDINGKPTSSERLRELKEIGREALEKMGVPTRRMAVICAGLVVSPVLLRAIIAHAEEIGMPLVIDVADSFNDIPVGYTPNLIFPLQFRARRSKRGQRLIEHQRKRKERI